MTSVYVQNDVEAKRMKVKTEGVSLFYRIEVLRFLKHFLKNRRLSPTELNCSMEKATDKDKVCIQSWMTIFR